MKCGRVCPKCGNPWMNKVKDARYNPNKQTFVRKRECICGCRWKTIEILDYRQDGDKE